MTYLRKEKEILWLPVLLLLLPELVLLPILVMPGAISLSVLVFLISYIY